MNQDDIRPADLAQYAVKFGFQSGAANSELLGVLAADDTVPPVVAAPKVLSRGPDDPTGFLFAGAGPGAGAVAAGTTILDMTAVASWADPNVATMLGSSSDPQAMLLVEGVRVRIDHAAMTVTQLRQAINNLQIRFSNSQLPTVYLPLFDFAGTYLDPEVGCEGATATLGDAVRRRPRIHWLDRPYVVNMATDTFDLFTKLGYTAVAGVGFEVELWGKIWLNGLGVVLNGACAPSVRDMIYRRRVRRGKASLSGVVANGGGLGALGKG